MSWHCIIGYTLTICQPGKWKPNKDKLTSTINYKPPMAIQHNFLHRTYMTQQNPGDRNNNNKLPAEQFMPLATTFRRRLLTGIGSASLVAVGANFAGTTTFLLGLSPETARSLKLDVIYPVNGYSRCINSEEGFGSLHSLI